MPAYTVPGMPAIALLAAVVLGLSYAIINFVFSSGQKEVQLGILPKGPPTLPIIGNLHQLPTAYPQLKYTEWQRKFGAIFTLKLGRQNLFVIGSRQLAKAILDKNGRMASYRPHMRVVSIMSRNRNPLFFQPDHLWRTLRAIMHWNFNGARCDADHVPVQEAEAAQLLRDLMLDPKNAIWHVNRYGMSITNTVVFGTRNATVDSPHMRTMFNVQHRWNTLIAPGAAPPVDIFPWLNWLPESWFRNWKSRAEQVGVDMQAFYTQRYEETVARRALGENTGSLMDYVLDNREKYGNLDELQIAYLGGVLLEGGSESASTVLLTAIKAVIAHPEVQEKAAREIEGVVGEGRSPRWSDYDQLPYVTMILKEAQRWRPVTPIGIPHALGADLRTDNTYGEGHLFLPKGSMVVTNNWGIETASGHWQQPYNFIPERFEGYRQLAANYAAGPAEKRDHFSFGSAHRICPAIQLAERTIFIALAKLLWAFKLEQGIDADGNLMANDCDPVTGYDRGATSMPNVFGLRATVRSEKRRATVMRELGEAERNVFSRFTAG